MTNSATGFRDPTTDALSAHGRTINNDWDDDDVIVLAGDH